MTGASDAVDWPVADAVGSGLVPAGPTGSRDELAEHVALLRASAQEAVPHVLRVTAMTPADGRDTSVPDALSRVLVVDRATWVRAAAETARSMLPDLAPPGSSPGTLARAAGGAEIGAALALASTRVLGQFDPFAPAPGRLLLVAPNILGAQRGLDAPARDFALWVCLHEQTHALQLAAAPWLADHLRARVAELSDDVARTGRELAEGPLPARLRAWWRTAERFVSAGREASLASRVLTPSQREVMAEIGAVMALLEGHADVMMDAVGPQVVPAVRTIRKGFDARRRDTSGLARQLGRLLGMEEKLAQYTDGAAFVREVRRAHGRDAVNLVWESPENLPTAREIHDPVAWGRRLGLGGSRA
ncbi:putative hydrolase/coenzyme F420 biosynthesis associated uncharacterized protein [Flavimobilis soli]|uniref:Putative hydrolase/coenzyme F420 biosynthesis associated uncharacterized protein n=1 Tax=Flavimobilis soli TaxID=442709 RepID=A0A2A9EER4_9MICO|nr:zinc-dependent metalloprotease [Flavimobilis soli]PFG37303.1 putative hydrolase/coenzyme F420 biosynthesis associated uncharacterized protein [Flavimobilis soli]